MNVELWKDQASWDSYVGSRADASNYHHWVWCQAVQETYGHRPYYLAAVENGAVRGVLPLVHIRSRLFGDSLVSVPFFSYGGVLADTDGSRDALLEKATELARELHVRHVELRQGEAGGFEGWQDSAAKVTMEIDLPTIGVELWNRFSPKTRKRIRYAQKHGLEPRWDGAEAVRYFYSVFAANMRNLGTPVYPRSWFENLCRSGGNQIRILTLWEKAKPVAGAFVVAFRDTFELPWAASLPESREKFSPLLLYWVLLERALQDGFRKVDLGRCTPGSGNHEFKKRWVCRERPLHWYYWLAPGAQVPHLRPDDTRFRWAVEIWKRLPLPIANSLGPRVVRTLP